MLLVANVAVADEFGGWKFTPPAGATKEVGGNVITFTKVTGSAYCKYGLYTARAPGASPADDVAYEWKNIVESSFTVKAASKPVSRKAKSLPYTAISANVTAGTFNFAIALYVLQPPGAVSSLLVAANDSATLAKCPITALVDSIVVAQPAATPAQPSVAAPVQPAQPAAPAAPAASESVAGTWGTTSTAINNGYSNGYQTRQYTFNADNTYVFHFEAFGGHLRSGYYHVVHETGTYAHSGAALTITPKASTVTVYDTNKNTKQVTKGALEKATYTVKRHYFEGIQQWNLVLTTAKATNRDGPFTSTTFPSSYLLEANPRIEWKYPSDR